jgi:hypothetical protein
LKKRSRKLISILLTLSLLVTLLVPLATPAAAGSSGSITALTTPTTSDDVEAPDGVNLGTILIQTVAGAVKTGNVFTVRLPEDFTFQDIYKDNATNQLVTAPAKYTGDVNAFASSTFTTEVLNKNEVRVTVNGAVYSGDAGAVYFDLSKIVVASGAPSGDIIAIVTSPASQGFPSGEVVVGKVTGGEVLVSVDEVKTFIDKSNPIILRFKETVKASFEATEKSMKLRLPNGFTWEDPIIADASLIWGVPRATWLDKLKFKVDGRDLYINVKDAGASLAGEYFSLPVVVRVDDETVAKYGDVKVAFSGDTDAIPTELVIANYNEMGSTVSAEDTTTVVAGKIGEEIGDIIVEETAPNTFTTGRTITLALPSFAKWSKLPDLKYENGITVKDVTFVGTDGRTLKYYVDKATSTGDPGKIKFKDAEILLSGDASGKVTVEVSGTAGAEGKVDVADVVAPVKATGGTPTEVKIGMNNQAAADLTITELQDEAIDNNKDLIVTLSNGVEWNDVPTIEVTEGDLLIDEATTNGSDLIIPVKGTSTTPASIKLSNIKVDVDRTVAEGDIKAKVNGEAVLEVNSLDLLSPGTYAESTDGSYYELDGHKAFRIRADGAFPNISNVASAVIAKVGTPAPADQKKSAKFVIGDTSFTVNDVEYTMDVAPYVKDGRTYLPVRYVAQALGVADSNILWDNATQKVTLIKGGTVVQLTIGSNVLLVNGAAITMDVPAEITSDRTMLPFRFIAQAFGATVGWDEATQTVTMDL